MSTELAPELHQPPETSPDRRRWVGLGVLAAGLGMIVLDGTIVGVALPAIIADLHLSLTNAQWVNSLYSVVFAALLLTLGRLADRVGRRTIFIVGVLIFCLGSVFAALSGTASALIASRALQGVGGAMVLPASLSSVNATFRGRDRAVAFGVWGAVMAGVAAIGPLLGGWLTTSFSWPWIFLVNIPVGALVIVGALLTVSESREPATSATGLASFDLGGLLLSAAGFGLIVFGLIEATSLGWWRVKQPLSIGTWTSTLSISATPIAIALGVVLVACFFLFERRRTAQGRSVVLDVSLFRIRTFAAGNLAASMVAVGEFALVFVLPLYLVSVLHLSTMGAGWVLAAMAGGAFLSGAQARHLSARLGAPKVVVLGVGLELIGVLATAVVVGTAGSAWLIAAVLAVYGVGLGLASAQLTSTVLADVPAAESGSASATQSTVRQLGSAVGSAVAGTILGHFVGVNLAAADATQFVHGTQATLFGAAVFLALALVGAINVARIAQAAHAGVKQVTEAA